MKTFDLKTTYVTAKGCFFEQNRYLFGGRLCLSIVGYMENDEDGSSSIPESLMDITVQIPCCGLNSDEVVIKSYSENEGLLEALIGLGFIASVERSIEVGGCGVTAPVCKLNMEKIDEYSQSIA